MHATVICTHHLWIEMRMQTRRKHLGRQRRAAAQLHWQGTIVSFFVSSSTIPDNLARAKTSDYIHYGPALRASFSLDSHRAAGDPCGPFSQLVSWAPLFKCYCNHFSDTPLRRSSPVKDPTIEGSDCSGLFLAPLLHCHWDRSLIKIYRQVCYI